MGAECGLKRTTPEYGLLLRGVEFHRLHLTAIQVPGWAKYHALLRSMHCTGLDATHRHPGADAIKAIQLISITYDDLYFSRVTTSDRASGPPTLPGKTT
jgi:hypothetical protein